MHEVAMDSGGGASLFASTGVMGSRAMFSGISCDGPVSEDAIEVLRDRERKIMELLGTSSPDQILHDLRNVLNEKELFRALAFRDEK